MTIDSVVPRRVPASAILIWVLVAVGGVLAAVLARPQEALGWLPIVLAGGIITTFCVQLAIVRKEGLVNRIIVSVSGGLIILVLISAVLGAIMLATA